MTLSNESVKRKLSKEFTCIAIDTDGETTAGASFAHAPKDPAPSCIRGNGEHNLQLLMLTPDGRLLSALAGFVSPEELVRELDLALKANREVAKQQGDAAAKALKDIHTAEIESVEPQKSDDPFATFEVKRRIDDHRYSIDHALMGFESYDPASFVGNATTFFGSSSGGTPTGRIGDRRALEMAGQEEKTEPQSKDKQDEKKEQKPQERSKTGGSETRRE